MGGNAWDFPMNIFLIPYTWARHLVPALVVAGAMALYWWIFLVVTVQLGPSLYEMGLLWRQGAEGGYFLIFASVVVSFASLFVEGSLRRRSVVKRVGYAALGGGLTLFFSIFAFLIAWWTVVLLSGDMRTVVEDPAAVALRFRGVLWGAVGLSAGLGTWMVRKGVALVAGKVAERFGDRLGEEKANAALIAAKMETSVGVGFFGHTLGATAASALGAGVWDGVGYYGVMPTLGIISQDLYLAPALGLVVWGFLHGALTWGIPPELYAGWIRVLSPFRYGHRIPVDRPDGTGAERFVGHFPRGLDMHMPAQNGVAELHASFVVDDTRHYTVRGLSVQPTTVKRLMEQVKIHYNPLSPAPLETALSMEDRVIMSDGANEVVLEFILLPKEER
ncbi:MAG: hypothetical protein JXX28_05040 [Deltaproteobacteria bacterium]|nr:hypothetical protein [Deltaproteobacteria bacterium]